MPVQNLLNRSSKLKLKAFTLVELLLVVTIIAILAGIIVMVINPEAQKAKVRDVSRQKDLNVLSLALEQYYSEHNAYPAGDIASLSILTTPVSYIKVVPTDPRGAGYLYCYTPSAANQNFVMCAVQEGSVVQGTAPDGSSCAPAPAGFGRYCVSNPL